MNKQARRLQMYRLKNRRVTPFCRVQMRQLVGDVKIPRKLKKKLLKQVAHLFLLKNGKVRPVSDNDRRYILRWGRTFDDKMRRVGYDEVGDVMISTVFLGVNHAFMGGTPVLFETMTFPDSNIIARYTTLKDARHGHRKTVEMIRDRDGR